MSYLWVKTRTTATFRPLGQTHIQRLKPKPNVADRMNRARPHLQPTAAAKTATMAKQKTWLNLKSFQPPKRRKPRKRNRPARRRCSTTGITHYRTNTEKQNPRSLQKGRC